MSGSMENPGDPGIDDGDLLEAYKALQLAALRYPHIIAANRTAFVAWFVAEVQAANITARVVAALFEELFAAQAILPVEDGFVFSQDQLATCRFADMIADEHTHHLADLEWVKDALATWNRKQPE